MREIDETEIDILLLQIIVLEKTTRGSKQGYIEDILPL